MKDYQNGIRRIGQIHLDHVTTEMMCTDLHEFGKIISWSSKKCFEEKTQIDKNLGSGINVGIEELRAS